VSKKLAEKADLFSKMTEEQKDIIGKLNPLNIEARYPEYKDRIAAGLTKDICKNLNRLFIRKKQKPSNNA